MLLATLHGEKVAVKRLHKASVTQANVEALIDAISDEGYLTADLDDIRQCVKSGLPLGDIEPVESPTMINLIGEVPEVDHLLSLPGVRLHLYGKAPRPGRKVGHVNVVGNHPETVAELRRLTGLD